MMMNIGKVAAIGGFAVGAAVAFAPLAAADDLTTAVDSEISSLNSIFDTEALLAGDYGDIVHNPGTFDTVPVGDAPPAVDSSELTTLDYELYGVDPLKDAISPSPGADDLFNGALAEFSNAYNTELYSMLNGGAAMPETAWSTDLFGPEINWDVAFVDGTATASHAVTSFLTDGWNDLVGYFDIGTVMVY
jgi:hypothetical protein